MPISPDQVEYVALLARLELTDQEKARFAAQLDAILEFVGKLDTLPTDGVEPLIHIAPRHTVLREDAVGPSLPPDEALANAPDQGDGQFRVPRILD